MDEAIHILDNQISEISNSIKKASAFLKTAPEGYLRISKNKNSFQYYWCKKDTIGKYKNGKFINKKNRNTAKALAQKKYAVSFINEAQKQLDYLTEAQKNLKNYDLNKLKCFEDQFCDARKSLITPFILSDSEYAKKWLESKRNNHIKNRYPFKQEFITENEEIVRSKSEKIIADKLKLMNIPYIYEYPFKLKNGEIIFPDFLVLNTRTKKEYIWEHFGIMDDYDYSNNSVKKINSYQNNKIYVGEKLIVTMETQTYQLSTRAIEEIVKKYLL